MTEEHNLDYELNYEHPNIGSLVVAPQLPNNDLVKIDFNFQNNMNKLVMHRNDEVVKPGYYSKSNRDFEWMFNDSDVFIINKFLKEYEKMLLSVA